MDDRRMLERRIEFTPAFDRRHPEPSKNYGIHGVEMRWYLLGEQGAVQWVVYTNWQLPAVQVEMDAREPNKRFPYFFHEPQPADLGYHAKRQMYDGQEPHDDCHLLGCACYYDGSGLNAQRIMDVLRREGSDGVWRELEAYYEAVFAAAAIGEQMEGK